MGFNSGFKGLIYIPRIKLYPKKNVVVVRMS